jgi:integrase
VRCTYCKKLFTKRHTQRSMPFCKMEHFYAWRRQQTDEKKVGAFAPMLQDFMADCVPRFLAPSSFNDVRCNLAAFFHFLRRRRIRSLESVNPRVISSFLADLKKTRKKSAGKVVGNIRLFFDWLIINRKRKTANPVIPKFHTQTQVTRLPRPYEAKELQLIHSLIEETGDLRLQLAIAIGEESGLRISEVCNLRLSNVDLEKQQLFVRLPNKTNTERYAPFHTRAKNALAAWLNELARAIIEASRGSGNSPSVPHDIDFEGVGPALVEGCSDQASLVSWIAERIKEIEGIVRQLPSIAIFVNEDQDVQPIADALGRALENNNIQVEACLDGKAVGQENDVRVFAIEHIKGLEFEAVFFIGVDHLAQVHPRLYDKYLYVGTTRAATYLGVTCAGSLPTSLSALRPMFTSNWSETPLLGGRLVLAGD